MRVDVPGRGLLVKQAAGLGAALLQRQVHLADAQVLNFAVRLAGRKGAAFTCQVQMVKADAADHACRAGLALARCGADKHRLALAPPARRTGQLVGVGVAAGAAGQMVDMDVLHRAAVPHPDAHRAGAVVNDAVAQRHIADHTVGLGSDFQRRIAGM